MSVAYIQLLADQTKHSDAGVMIENDYYIFHAIDKVSGRREIIQCSMGAVGSEFLKNRFGKNEVPAWFLYYTEEIADIIERNN